VIRLTFGQLPGLFDPWREDEGTRPNHGSRRSRRAWFGPANGRDLGVSRCRRGPAGCLGYRPR
jgi:hypothetical protein